MSFFTVLISSKIALGVLGVAAVAAGGTAAHAVAGNLPEASQAIVHSVRGTPDPTL
ncbi:MAG: protein tyrosine phosphatase, partial [Microbacteriaceae bacterium]|nr:protein tyrosine phosphatase [Microbacteriaceae bacterium]